MLMGRGEWHLAELEQGKLFKPILAGDIEVEIWGLQFKLAVCNLEEGTKRCIQISDGLGYYCKIDETREKKAVAHGMANGATTLIWSDHAKHLRAVCFSSPL